MVTLLDDRIAVLFVMCLGRHLSEMRGPEDEELRRMYQVLRTDLPPDGGKPENGGTDE